MSRNNDVFQVLVPTAAVAVTGGVATGTTLDALTEGQIGAFGYESNVALDPTAKPTVPFYLAVKVLNLDGQEDIVKSTGHSINPKNEVSYTHKAYTAPVQMVTSSPFKVIQCGNEVGVKIEIRNQEAYRLNGYNQVVKNFIVPTSECIDCETSCQDGNCTDVLTALVALINSDEDGLVVATQTAPTATDPLEACDSTAAGYVAGELILTVQAKAFADWCSINLNYFSPRQTEIIVTPIDGFEATVIDTAMVYEDGAGYDVKQMEYEAGGWNGKPGPYRASDLMGVAFEGFQYFADASKNYDVYHASYDLVSVSGWRKDDHFARTIVAAENGATATLITTFLDVIFG